MSWTQEQTELLKSLWNEGLTASEIGRRLSMTKNAVIGKAHRLGLDSRPSPIRKAALKAKKEQKLVLERDFDQAVDSMHDSIPVEKKEKQQTEVETPKDKVKTVNSIKDTDSLSKPAVSLSKPAVLASRKKSAKDLEKEADAWLAQAESESIPSSVSSSEATRNRPAVSDKVRDSRTYTQKKQEKELAKELEAAEKKLLALPRRAITGGAGTIRSCQWPHGNPGEEDFYFCSKTVEAGRPYCEEHCAEAYLAHSSRRMRSKN